MQPIKSTSDNFAESGEMNSPNLEVTLYEYIYGCGDLSSIQSFICHLYHKLAWNESHTTSSLSVYFPPTCIIDGFQTLLSILSDRILDTASDRCMPTVCDNTPTGSFVADDKNTN